MAVQDRLVRGPLIVAVLVLAGCDSASVTDGSDGAPTSKGDHVTSSSDGSSSGAMDEAGGGTSGGTGATTSDSTGTTSGSTGTTSGSTGTTSSNDESSSGGPTAALSFEADVRPIIDAHCNIGCHMPGGIPFSFEALTTQGASLCNLPLVEPGAPQQSALWIKLSEDISMTGENSFSCGREMPATGEGGLLFVDPEAAEVVRSWIEQGAHP